MKNKIILGIILIGIIFCLTGCMSESNALNDERFIKVYEQAGYSIIVDKNTKVMYLITTNDFTVWGNTGITTLLNADGTPLLYGGE